MIIFQRFIKKVTKANRVIQKQGFIFLVGLSVCIGAKAEGSLKNADGNQNSAPPTGNYLDLSSSVKDSASTSTSAEQSGFWTKLWGKPAPPALYLAMVSFHLEPGSRDDNWNNQLIAGTYDGFFAGTFINSFYDRGWAFGIQRMWDKEQISEHITNSPGYRLGLVSGYDDRMMELADHTPLLPFPQVIDDIVIGDHVGIELSWSVVVVSAGFVITF